MEEIQFNNLKTSFSLIRDYLKNHYKPCTLTPEVYEYCFLSPEHANSWKFKYIGKDNLVKATIYKLYYYTKQYNDHKDLNEPFKIACNLNLALDIGLLNNLLKADDCEISDKFVWEHPKMKQVTLIDYDCGGTATFIEGAASKEMKAFVTEMNSYNEQFNNLKTSLSLIRDYLKNHYKPCTLTSEVYEYCFLSPEHANSWRFKYIGENSLVKATIDKFYYYTKQYNDHKDSNQPFKIACNLNLVSDIDSLDNLLEADDCEISDKFVWEHPKTRQVILMDPETHTITMWIDSPEGIRNEEFFIPTLSLDNYPIYYN